MSIMVVVDTNALWVHENLPYSEGANWKGLCRVARRGGGDVTVVVPEVVLREHAHHETANVEKAHQKTVRSLRTAKNRARRAGLTIAVPDPDLVAAVALPSREAIVGEMRDALRAAGVVIAPLPAASHSDLVEWSLEKQPPFDESDKGYRDALLWTTILEVVDADRCDVVFFTNDKDFRQKDALHPYLQESFDDVANGRTITPAATLTEAVALVETSTEDNGLTAPTEGANDGFDAASEETDQDDWYDGFPDESDILRRAIPAQLDMLIGAEIKPHHDKYQSGFDLPLPGEIETAQIESIDPDLEELWIDTHEDLDGDTTLGSVTFPADLHYEGFVHKSDQFGAEDANLVVSAADWNRHYTSVLGELRVEIELNFIICGDELEALDITSITPG